MDVFNDDGSIKMDGFDPEVQNIIITATQLPVFEETRSLKCKAGHLFLALLATIKNSQEYMKAFELGLMADCTFGDVSELVRLEIKEDVGEQVFNGKKEDFDSFAIHILETCDRIKDEDGKILWKSEGPVEFAPFCTNVLLNQGSETVEVLSGLFDFQKAGQAFIETFIKPKPVVLPELFSGRGELKLEYFDDVVVSILETAKERAGGLGYEKIMPPHLFLAFLERPGGTTEELILLQAKPEVGRRTCAEVLTRFLSLGPGIKSKKLELMKYHISEHVREIITDALELAFQNNKAIVSERFLLKTILESDQQGMTGRCLSSKEIELDISKMIRDLDYKLSRGEPEEEATPYFIPGELIKSDDLTYLAKTGQIEATVGQDDAIESILRGLHKRQNNNIIITGQAGVGKTALVRELSRRMGNGDFQFLKRKKIVRVDCEGIPPDKSRDVLNTIISHVKGRNDIIVCLDNFEKIVRYAGANESHNRSVIKVALKNRDFQLIVIIEDRYFIELLSNDYSLMELFNRVEVREISEDEAIEICKKVVVPRYESLYGFKMDDRATNRAVIASKEFIMGERLPVKAIKIIRDAFEHVSFEKEVKCREDVTVKEEDVVRVISERTGIDESTIAATGSKKRFYDILSRNVVGQKEAVKTVAKRLEAIKAGATREGKPAGVFLFAGLTGTGKTELAKAIARVYSNSGKISVYPMTNFTESHSISGITGVPPGYVGYEAGGRLINDLNADPYGIILFDEAEKADRDIWQAMLSLFDEAWIEDRRNVKAFGNRAIFILTSNAGHETITKSLRQGKDIETIKNEVKKVLVEYENEKKQRVFSPEFLARFTDIVIFNPLSQDAMEKITQKQVDRLIKEWQTKRNKKILVAKSLIELIAKLSYEENEDSGGTKGARIISRYVADLVESKLIEFMVEQTEVYNHSSSIEIILEPTEKVAVRPQKTISLKPSRAKEKANTRISQITGLGVKQGVSDICEEVDKILQSWSKQIKDSLPESSVEEIRNCATNLKNEVKQGFTRFNESLENEKKKFIEKLEEVTPEAEDEIE